VTAERSTLLSSARTLASGLAKVLSPLLDDDGAGVEAAGVAAGADGAAA